ncbi:MAG: hypothetical protein ABIT37_03770 [Luteolibacter sp.]
MSDNEITTKEPRCWSCPDCGKGMPRNYKKTDEGQEWWVCFHHRKNRNWSLRYLEGFAAGLCKNSLVDGEIAAQKQLEIFAPKTITREEWLVRCAAHLRSLTDVPSDTAMDIAESQLENLNDDLTENPEAAADDEISSWPSD